MLCPKPSQISVVLFNPSTSVSYHDHCPSLHSSVAPGWHTADTKGNAPLTQTPSTASMQQRQPLLLLLLLLLAAVCLHLHHADAARLLVVPLASSSHIAAFTALTTALEQHGGHDIHMVRVRAAAGAHDTALPPAQGPNTAWGCALQRTPFPASDSCALRRHNTCRSCPGSLWSLQQPWQQHATPRTRTPTSATPSSMSCSQRTWQT